MVDNKDRYKILMVESNNIRNHITAVRFSRFRQVKMALVMEQNKNETPSGTFGREIGNKNV